uniref:Uncharacterized protein n=1 Tax=viral metagenome TaxID=1070528 RepID=A0A6M3LZL2_9ZZZZ
MLEKTMLERHYELWDWLCSHPSAEKRDFPKWKHNKGHWKEVRHLCFLCELYKNDCRACLLDCCYEKLSLFVIWANGNTDQRIKAAEQIRDIIGEVKR